MPIAREHVEWRKHGASFRVCDRPIPDYHDFINAIRNGPSTRAVVSFDIEWRGVTKLVTVDKTNNAGFGGSDWGGRFAEVHTTAAWSACQPGFEFRSDPASTSEPVFGFVGHERNGVFFDG